jgi:hypothetical protein
VKLSTSFRTSRLDVVNTAVGTNAYVRIYSGTPPATVDTALSGNLMLAELRGNASQFGTVSSATLTVSAMTADSSANHSGTPTFARVFKSDGTTACIQVTAGVGSGELNCDDDILAGQNVAVSSFTIVEQNA